MFKLILVGLVLAVAWIKRPGAGLETGLPVRFIFPIQGVAVDVVARLVPPRLQELWGHPVSSRRSLAREATSARTGSKSAPDGHTILVAFTAPITVNPTLFEQMPYDPQKDLAPITLAVTTPQFLTVHPSVPAPT